MGGCSHAYNPGGDLLGFCLLITLFNQIKKTYPMSRFTQIYDTKPKQKSNTFRNDMIALLMLLGIIAFVGCVMFSAGFAYASRYFC
jgi:uncharacterized BrkB/YihY/UPF0761 family membrane protein